MSADEQALWVEKYERDQARHTCGHPRDVCSDPERKWYPQRSVDYVLMETTAANRMYDALHKDLPYHDGRFRNWSAEPSNLTPYHYRDGVTVWVATSDRDPHDHFLGGAEDCTHCREVNRGNQA